MYISNSVFNILIGLDNIGVLKRDMENETMSINTLGNEYKIILKRNCKSLFTEEYSTTFYKCSLKFINIFGNEVVTLLGNEIEMSKFLDVVYFFLESDQTEVIFQLPSYDGLCFIKFTKEYTSTMKSLYNMIIMKDNPYNGCKVPITTCKFDDETISTFIDAIYFYFLIDIDDTGKMAKVYRYIDHDMWLASNNMEEE